MEEVKPPFIIPIMRFKVPRTRRIVIDQLTARILGSITDRCPVDTGALKKSIAARVRVRKA